MKISYLYCSRLESGKFYHFYADPELVTMSGGSGEVFKVKVIEDTSANPEYYGWWNNTAQRFTIVAPDLRRVETCFAYGTDMEERRGYGKLFGVRVELLQVGW